MRTHARVACLLTLVVPAALTGCFKLARESPKLQMYVLGDGSASGLPTPPAGAPSAGRGAFTIGLRRVEMASYLSVPTVMMRRGANELIVSQFHRWGGDLDQSVNHALGVYLARSPRVHSVDVAPWTARAQHDLLVQLHVMRFEGVVADSSAREGRVHVMAGWDIIRPFDGAVMVRGSTDDRGGAFRVGDYAGLVAGLDAALMRVARDISVCLARFPNDSTPPASCATF